MHAQHCPVRPASGGASRLAREGSRRAVSGDGVSSCAGRKARRRHAEYNPARQPPALFRNPVFSAARLRWAQRRRARRAPRRSNASAACAPFPARPAHAQTTSTRFESAKNPSSMGGRRSRVDPRRAADRCDVGLHFAPQGRQHASGHQREQEARAVVRCVRRRRRYRALSVANCRLNRQLTRIIHACPHGPCTRHVNAQCALCAPRS